MIYNFSSVNISHYPPPWDVIDVHWPPPPLPLNSFALGMNANVEIG